MRTTPEIDRERLIVDHIWLADVIAKQMGGKLPRHYDRDDVRSAALLGLTDAAQRYDPANAQQAKFATFANKRIRGAVLDWVRQEDHVDRSYRRKLTAAGEHGPRLRSLNAIQAQWRERGECIPQLTFRESERFHEPWRLLEEVLALVGQEYRGFLRMRAQGLTMHEIAGRLGVTPRYAFEVQGKIFKCLVRRLNRLGFRCRPRGLTHE